MQLEKDLEEALKAAGRPPVIPRDTSNVTMTSSEDVVLPQVVQPVARKRPPVKDLSAENLSDVSVESDLSSPELSPGLCQFYVNFNSFDSFGIH